MEFKNVNKLFTLIIHYKFLKAPSYETQSYYNAPFCKRKQGDSSVSKSSYGPVLHSYIWMT
jgi:hypothetical protein